MSHLWHDALVNLAAHPVGWPLARFARRLPPVLALPGFGVVISDAEVAHQVLVDDSRFTKNGDGSFAAVMTELLGPFALGNMDGASHARLRATLHDVVAPSQAAELLRGCQLPLDELLVALRAGQTADVVAAMRWMSGRVTFDMLGVTTDGDERTACEALTRLGEQIARGLDFRSPSRTRIEQGRADVEQLTAYAQFGYASPDAPTRSFVRRLRDLGLSFDEARGVIGLVFLAGTLTTAAAVPRLLALLIDSGQFRLLQRQPDLIPQAVSEGLRFTTPVPATMRIARQAATVGRHRVREGTRLFLLTCNMARDPRVFDRADTFDITRKQPARARNLWYGAGPHFCLGFAIAQRQLQMVFGALAALDGELSIVRRRAQRGVLVAAYRELGVALKPVASGRG